MQIENPFHLDGAATIDSTDVDGLIALHRNLSERMRRDADLRRQVVMLLAQKIPGAGSGRIRGEHLECKVTQPNSLWSSARLQKACDAYQEASHFVRKKVTYEPRLNEVKKLKTTSGKGEFARMRQMILDAELEGTALPRVEVVE